MIDVTQMSYKNPNKPVRKNLVLLPNPQVTGYTRWGANDRTLLISGYGLAAWFPR